MLFRLSKFQMAHCSLVFSFLVSFQDRLEEREAQLRGQFDERERELAELNRVTSRRLAEAETRCAQLQSSKSTPLDLQYSHKVIHTRTHTHTNA